MAIEVPDDELESLVASFRATAQIPRMLDGKLLGISRTALGADLNNDQKKSVRAAFIMSCESRLASLAIAKVLPPHS